MVLPGPRSLASLIALATLIALEPPSRSPSCFNRSNIIGNASVSEMLYCVSILAFSRLPVILTLTYAFTNGIPFSFHFTMGIMMI